MLLDTKLPPMAPAASYELAGSHSRYFFMRSSVYTAGSGEVEIPRLPFHIRRFVPDTLQAEVLHQPDRRPRIEIGHMLAAQRNDEIAESPLIGGYQRTAVPRADP